MLAAPGAGKGTQARRLAQHHGLEHVASGDLLRAEIVAGTAVGRAAESYVNRGDLVPDDVILEILGPRLKSAAEHGGYVLDGFPRNRAQAERAYQMATDVGGIELQAVIHLEVEREELRRRMLARADAESRSDDTRVTIEHRFEVFDAETAPLIGYYEGRGLLHAIDGSQDVDAVADVIVEALSGDGDEVE